MGSMSFCSINGNGLLRAWPVGDNCKFNPERENEALCLGSQVNTDISFQVEILVM